ncbi:hypothetical protein Bca52824_037892 [Brassica carinata]|uniref:Uncharacterized protein n=1 Tax=Brassica carinata TaxID=52824 RepID=A0A8X7RNN5_BRACI|nr:hypothetical protein Bca52824_037892 [Brassica carinata]
MVFIQFVTRYQMEMSIADDADGGPFVAFDGEIQKLHNMRAYEAGHLMDGDDDDGDDLPGNPSALPNVVIEGNERLETSSPGTSSSGPATKKPLLSKSGQEGMKSLSE